MKWFKVKLLLFLVSGFLFWPGDFANACCGCTDLDCGESTSLIEGYHEDIRENTKDHFDGDLDAFEDWLIEEFFFNEILPAMRMMTTQMNATAMQQAQIIGSFFDAKQQLETQRLFQELQLEAHRDYIPSDEFCWFGTNTRSMAASQSKSRYNTFVLSQKSVDRQLGNKNSIGADSVETDLMARWENFRRQNCDPADNNRSILHQDVTGLQLACDSNGALGGGSIGADATFRMNRDVDYTRLIDLPRTLKVDFSDGNATVPDEVDVISMGRNLYGHRVLSRDLSAPKLVNDSAQNLYFALRSVVAKRSVAEYTFNAIIGLKSEGTDDPVLGHTRQYLAAILRDLYPFEPDPLECLTKFSDDDRIQQLCDGDIYSIMGVAPSYYSQLEIMAKKMYQNPQFYVKLYDTPANVARRSVAMKAIELMLDREIYESQLRREMTVSVLLSSKLRAEERRANEGLYKIGP